MEKILKGMAILAIGILIVIALIISKNIRIIGDSKPSEYNGDWNLILVNSENALPKNYDIDLTLLSNGISVDSRIYPDLQKMFDRRAHHKYRCAFPDERHVLSPQPFQ